MRGPLSCRKGVSGVLVAVTVTGHVSPDTRGRAGSLHTSWSVLVVLAMTYRGCLQQHVDVSEDTEVQRLEGGDQTSRDETREYDLTLDR